MALPRFLYSVSHSAQQPLISATGIQTEEHSPDLEQHEIAELELEVEIGSHRSGGSRDLSYIKSPFSDGAVGLSSPGGTLYKGTTTFSRGTLPRDSANSDPGDYVFYKHDKNRTKWEEAVLFVREGEDNDKFYYHPAGRWSKLAYTILHHPVFYVSDLAVSVLLMLLALVETPPVIDLHEGQEKTVISIHGVLEVFFLILLAFDIVLRLIWLQPKNFIRHKRTVLVTIVLVVMFAEAITVLVRQKSHFRITRALRPLFFIDTHLMGGMRRVLRQIFLCLKPITDVLLLLLFIVTFFSLIGYLVFARVDPDYFLTLDRTFTSLFIALTTANHPDVMMEAYSQYAVTPLFFIIYLIITLYFISNVLLAVVYSSFSEQDKKKFKKLFLHKREALRHAYSVLAGPDGIQFQDFLFFMLIYQPRTPEWQVMCMFKALHKEHHLQHTDLRLVDFYGFYEVRGFKWRQITVEGEDLVWFGNFHHRIKPFFYLVHWLVKWRWFNVILNLVVLVNLFFLLIYTLTISGDEVGDRFERLNRVLPVSFVFIAIYFIEIVIKIIGLGPIGYFRKFWNIFDFLVISASLVTLSLEIDSAYHYLAIVRPLKLIRLLRLKRRYRDILNTLVVLTPRLVSVGFLLAIIYYFFAIIGIEVFQGKVEPGCCNESWYGVGSYYQGAANESTSNVFWLNNFDNILRGYVTLFILMVVNNWHVIMEGFASQVHNGWLVRIYFMSFYMVTLVVLQVVIAFIVEAFVFKIQTTEKKRICTRCKSSNCEHLRSTDDCDSVEDYDRKKEVDVMLVDADINKLKYEVAYQIERTREQKKFSFNRFFRHMRRIDFTIFPAPCVLKYSGRRLRTKDDIYLLMYKSELKMWIMEQERKLEGEEGPEPSMPLRTRVWKGFKSVVKYILE